MNEIKKTMFQILALYVVSTTAFLGVIFGTWYFGEINTLKSRSFYEADRMAKKLINVLAKRGKYAYYVNTIEGKKAVLQAISIDVGRRIMVFDARGELIYNNMKFAPDEIPQKNGVFIVGNHVILNSYGRPHFLDGNRHLLRNSYGAPRRHVLKKADEVFRIVIDGGNIGDLLWDLRFKIWGLFIIFSLMTGIVGYFLVRLALKPIQQKIRDLDDFIKDATHEINTPLSVLQMSIERIDKSVIPSNEIKKIHYAQIASKTIENIYHGLIYASFGRVGSEVSQIEMNVLLEERIEFFSLLFGQKKIEVTKDITPVILEADQKSIVLVIDNLLSNAYKYTPKGGKVEIKLAKDGEDSYLLVKDNGYGIKEGDLKKIFDRYERFERSGGGFGLGLNIVKRICDEFQIKLIIQSEYKKGSEFILRWKNSQGKE